MVYRKGKIKKEPQLNNPFIFTSIEKEIISILKKGSTTTAGLRKQFKGKRRPSYEKIDNDLEGLTKLKIVGKRDAPLKKAKWLWYLKR